MFHAFILVLSRDLDSPLTLRERAAVDVWLASNKSFHVMRDHPEHGIPVPGGMWGFRPSLDRSVSSLIHNKIHDRRLVTQYSGSGDQTFLSRELWPYVKSNCIAHDSFHCKIDFGQKSEPFPTQRRLANETYCFVGCPLPCCDNAKVPFDECPKECRPVEHPEWIYC